MIQIKQTNKKCTISDYDCFEIFDKDGKKIDKGDTDSIWITLSNIERGSIHLDSKDGVIRLWLTGNATEEITPGINSLLVEYKGRKVG